MSLFRNASVMLLVSAVFATGSILLLNKYAGLLTVDGGKTQASLDTAAVPESVFFRGPEVDSLEVTAAVAQSPQANGEPEYNIEVTVWNPHDHVVHVAVVHSMFVPANPPAFYEQLLFVNALEDSASEEPGDLKFVPGAEADLPILTGQATAKLLAAAGNQPISFSLVLVTNDSRIIAGPFEGKLPHRIDKLPTIEHRVPLELERKRGEGVDDIFRTVAQRRRSTGV